MPIHNVSAADLAIGCRRPRTSLSSRGAAGRQLQEGTVVADRVGETPCVFLAGLHRAERTIAERLMRLANGTLPWP